MAHWPKPMSTAARREPSRWAATWTGLPCPNRVRTALLLRPWGLENGLHVVLLKWTSFS